jgi:PKD repeat protein/outer membrane murein-binding lipoprotein Lpp
MKKQYLLGSFIISTLLIPVFASAATADEIKAQIQSLLSQITALQTQLNRLASDTSTTISTPSNSCPNLYRTLSRGSRGGDVASLQQFLIVQGLLSSDSATGFFGSMTEAAVQRWQAQNSIVMYGDASTTGYGVVGARTRVAIAARCGTKPPIVQSCQQIMPPQCTNGTLVSLGTDQNGCSLGYQCKAISIACPDIRPLQCTNGTLISNGTDSNGCSLGYSCKQVLCPIYNACPSGYTAETSIDGNGCTIRTCTPPPTSSSLRATPNSGQAPLTISLQAPQDVMTKMQKCVYSIGWFGASGNGLYVDWGDGRTDPQYSQSLSGQSCASAVQSHIYTAPGTYTIKVGSWHPGPTDAPITDWEGTTVVSVSGSGSAISLDLLAPLGGETYQYQEFPTIKWHITTNKKVSLRIELLDQDGNVVASETKNDIGYNGEDSSQIRPRTWDTYDTLLRAGKNRFSVRVSIVDDGKVVAQKRSGDLTMSALWTNNLTGGLPVSPTSGAAPLTVTLNYNIWHPSCISYRLDWGDGSTPDTLIQPVQQSCLLDSQNKVFTHTYTRSGDYTVIMKSNNNDPFKDLDSIVMYESSKVQVQSNGFTASPATGPAPLTVTFSYAPLNSADIGIYSIDFGDGQSGTPTQSCVSGNCSLQASHVYTSSNPYAATLKRLGDLPDSQPQTVGTATISVTH